jgi:hypothetical protein
MESLRMFGGARFIISSLSSKSLSVGCLLAAFEKRTRGDKSRVRVGMAHIETRRYEAACIRCTVPATDCFNYPDIAVGLTDECYLV